MGGWVRKCVGGVSKCYSTNQGAKEISCGNHPLESQLEGSVWTVHCIIVDVAPLGAVAMVVGVRIQLNSPIRD